MYFWTTDSGDYRRRYHLDPDCFRLRCGLGRVKTNKVVPITNPVGLKPCSWCVYEFPKHYQPWCDYCQSIQACQHNGGIAVKTKTGKIWYVWPDQTARHTPLRAL